MNGGLEKALENASSLLKELGDPKKIDFENNSLTSEAFYKLKQKGLSEDLIRSVCWASLRLNALEAATTAKASGADLDLTVDVLKVLNRRLGGNLFIDESSFRAFTSQHELNARISLADDYKNLIEELTGKLVQSDKVNSPKDCKRFLTKIASRLAPVDQALSSAKEKRLGTGELYICVKTVEEIIANL